MGEWQRRDLKFECVRGMNEWGRMLKKKRFFKGDPHPYFLLATVRILEVFVNVKEWNCEGKEEAGR